MIVAIEGPSAAGKTTWCRSRYPSHSVLEPPDNATAPDLFADPAEVARFWVNYNLESWQRALALEGEHSLAVCDGDPFHLYYSWALWRSGAVDARLFEIESQLYRQALEQQQIGFVDHVLWLEVDMETLRRRALADASRRRKRHEMLLTLVPWMKMWFGERDRILPRSVRALTGETCLEELNSSTHDRYDVRLLDEMLQARSTSCVPSERRATLPRF